MSPPETQIVEHIKAIRELCKKTIADVMEIGRRLIECKTLVGHSNFGNFLNREFGWSERTAQRFMSVHELAEAKSDNLADLDLPISSLYMLAAPRCPLKSVTRSWIGPPKGEKIKYADVKAAVAPSSDDDVERKGRRQPTTKRNFKQQAAAHKCAEIEMPPSSEVQRKLAHLDELENSNRTLEIKLKGYQSDIEEARPQRRC